MSGRATGEERSPLSVPEREREREAPRFTIEEASAPSLPRGVRVSIAATLIHLVNHCWPSSAGREGGREGSTIDLHRRDRFLDSAVDRGRMHRVFRKWLRAHRSTPPQNFDSRLDPRCIFWGNWNFIVGNEARSFGGNILRMCVQGV